MSQQCTPPRLDGETIDNFVDTMRTLKGLPDNAAEDSMIK